MLREDHLVGADLLEHLLVNVALGLGDDLPDPQFLQIHGDKGAVAHVVCYGHDGAVIVAYAQGPEHAGVPGVAGHSVGHLT